MTKWADYLISGVWFLDTHISHVLLHKDTDGNSEKGVKTAESDVIKLIKANNSIITITWNYPGWQPGASVTYETVAGKEILRTVKNATTKDNLDNSINLKGMM